MMRKRPTKKAGRSSKRKRHGARRRASSVRRSHWTPADASFVRFACTRMKSAHTSIKEPKTAHADAAG
jgi:hypothetical protein